MYHIKRKITLTPDVDVGFSATEFFTKQTSFSERKTTHLKMFILTPYTLKHNLFLKSSILTYNNRY
jgi:hypothetical protein